MLKCRDDAGIVLPPFIIPAFEVQKFIFGAFLREK
jgi:hypothetical protein